MTNTKDATTNDASAAENGPSSQATDHVAQSAHDGIDAAANAVHPTIERAAASAHKAVEHADQMANQAAEAIEGAGAKGAEMITTSKNYLREHPVLTVGLAMTAGYVLSRILASR